jgi:hypothetical protein
VRDNSCREGEPHPLRRGIHRAKQTATAKSRAPLLRINNNITHQGKINN